MAYITTVNKSCANRAAALTEIFSQIVAMGWTLHDNQDGSSYRVYKSNHEDADRIYQYIKIQWTTANTIGFICYYAWNATTHAGTGAARSASAVNITTAETGFYLWVWGNMNLVFFMTKVSTTYYRTGWGHLPKRYYTTETDLTAAATAGTSVSIEVSDTSLFTAGKYYQIVGAAAEGRDLVQVASKTDSTHMVIASLPRNYGIGAVIGVCPIAFGIFDTGISTFGMTCDVAAAGTANSGATAELAAVIDVTNTHPDARIQEYVFAGIVMTEQTAGARGITGYSDAYFFAVGTTGIVVEDIFGVTQRDSGTSTGSNTSTTLNDTGKSWTTNEHADKVAVIDGGLAGAVGQIRKIASNTGTELTVDPAWAVTPDGTSTYRIFDEAYRYFATNRIIREGV
jgi:hypothetical protein